MESFNFWYAYVSFWVFFIGCCVGSFLNVCIYRIPREESVVKPRSHCPHCDKLIPWYDNIPIFSFLILRARCRKCHGKISIRYFLVETLVGVLFLLVWLQYGISALTPIYWTVMAGLVLGTFVDLEHMIIPDRVSIGGIIIGLILSPIVPQLHGVDSPLAGLMWGVIGFIAGFGSLWLVGVLGKLVLKKDAMGFGDVKLLGGLGALLGWQAVLFIIMVSSVIGSLVGVGFVVTKSKEWQSRVPYGPYIAIAAAIWILWGYRWWGMYAAWATGAGM